MILLILNSQLKMEDYICYNQELVRELPLQWLELLLIWLMKRDGLKKKLYLRLNQINLTNSYSQYLIKSHLNKLRNQLKV